MKRTAPPTPKTTSHVAHVAPGPCSRKRHHPAVRRVHLYCMYRPPTCTANRHLVLLSCPAPPLPLPAWRPRASLSCHRLWCLGVQTGVLKGQCPLLPPGTASTSAHCLISTSCFVELLPQPYCYDVQDGAVQFLQHSQASPHAAQLLPGVGSRANRFHLDLLALAPFLAGSAAAAATAAAAGAGVAGAAAFWTPMMRARVTKEMPPSCERE